MLESAAMLGQLLLLNGNVITLDAANPRSSALVLRDNGIVYVGDDETARRMCGQHDEVIDLQGHLALPAFTDSHIHFTGFAQSMENVKLEGCRSLQEAVARVQAGVDGRKPGDLIWGGGWNHLDWATPRFPNRQAIDAVAPNNPVILTRKDGHSVWLNSLALRAARITRDTPDPAGGVIDRDDEGEPTGILRENAISLLGGGIGAFAADISEPVLERAIAHAHRAGLVGIHNIEGANSLRAFQSLHAKDKLTLRVVHSIPDEKVVHAIELGIQRGLGDEWLKLQAIKIFADGSLGSQTADMRAPFVGDANNYGVTVTDSETMLELARDAAQLGLDVWTHAIGDRAIGRVLDVYAELRSRGLHEPILRVEHVQHLDPSDAARFRKLNVIASMQPIHQPSDMRMADALLGPERARWSYAFSSLQQAGAVLAFGSDCPVERLDPLQGIHAAVTRQNAEGDPPDGWYPEQRISAMDAVRAYTVGAAMASNDVTRAGSLTKGKRADVVVLSQDIFSIPPSEILNTRVCYTVAGGKVVHSD